MLEQILNVLEKDGADKADALFDEYRSRLSGENRQILTAAIARVRMLQAAADLANRDSKGRFKKRSA